MSSDIDDGVDADQFDSIFASHKVQHLDHIFRGDRGHLGHWVNWDSSVLAISRASIPWMIKFNKAKEVPI